MGKKGGGEGWESWAPWKSQGRGSVFRVQKKGRKRKEAGKESGANQGFWKLRGALEGRMVWV